MILNRNISFCEELVPYDASILIYYNLDGKINKIKSWNRIVVICPCCNCFRVMYYCDFKRSLSKRCKTCSSHLNMLGKKHTKESRLLISKNLPRYYGKNNPASRDDVKEKLRIFANSDKKKLSLQKQHTTEKRLAFRKRRLGCGNPMFGRKHSLSTRIKIRQKSIEHHCKTYGINKNNFIPTLGKNEKSCLDELESLCQFKIERNKNISFIFPDGYIQEINLVIEFDESHHFDIVGNYLDKDLKRQQLLESILQCKFFRIRETEWINNKQSVIQKFLKLIGSYVYV